MKHVFLLAILSSLLNFLLPAHAAEGRWPSVERMTQALQSPRAPDESWLLGEDAYAAHAAGQRQQAFYATFIALSSRRPLFVSQDAARERQAIIMAWLIGQGHSRGTLFAIQELSENASADAAERWLQAIDRALAPRTDKVSRALRRRAATRQAQLFFHGGCGSQLADAQTSYDELKARLEGLIFGDSDLPPARADRRWQGQGYSMGEDDGGLSFYGNRFWQVDVFALGRLMYCGARDALGNDPDIEVAALNMLIAAAFRGSGESLDLIASIFALGELGTDTVPDRELVAALWAHNSSSWFKQPVRAILDKAEDRARPLLSLPWPAVAPWSPADGPYALLEGNRPWAREDIRRRVVLQTDSPPSSRSSR